MKKRTTILGDYDTAAYGWTLTGWNLSDPEMKEQLVDKTGGDGSWDLSTVLTDGIPRYKDRKLTVTLECSEGTRSDRQNLISEMVNRLDGLVNQVTPPDYPDHYIEGRLHVAVNQNSLAFAMVTVTATVGPWLHRKRETVVELKAAAKTQKARIRNNGRRAVVPMLTTDGDVLVTYGGDSVQLDAGTYQWPALLLTPGAHELTYSGNGSLVIKYREAVLR